MIVAMPATIHNSKCGCEKCRRRYQKCCTGNGKHLGCGTTAPHAHCVCRLPMDIYAEMCDLCLLEGLVPLDVDEMEWDGVTYPSWRNNRLRASDPENYMALAQALGAAVVK